MGDPRFLGFALSATAFGVLTFWALIVYGNDASRAVAIGGAMAAAFSQFTGQDSRAHLLSIILAYVALFAGVISLLMMAGS